MYHYRDKSAKEDGGNEKKNPCIRAGKMNTTAALELVRAPNHYTRAASKMRSASKIGHFDRSRYARFITSHGRQLWNKSLKVNYALSFFLKFFFFFKVNQNKNKYLSRQHKRNVKHLSHLGWQDLSAFATNFEEKECKKDCVSALVLACLLTENGRNSVELWRKWICSAKGKIIFKVNSLIIKRDTLCWRLHTALYIPFRFSYNWLYEDLPNNVSTPVGNDLGFHSSPPFLYLGKLSYLAH